MQYFFTATKKRIYHMVQTNRVSLTEKFIICLINKCFFDKNKRQGLKQSN